MKFTVEYRVDTHQTDLNGCATVSAIMQYMQETASLQHEKYGPHLDTLRENGKAFILSRAALDVHLPLYAQDRVTVDSWLNEAKGFGYFRNSVIKRNGQPIAEMAAFWGAINIETRRPIKVEEIPLGFGCDSETLETSSPVRLRIPRELELQLIDEHKVVYSDCDMNRHMNNTRYPGVFCDCLDMLGKRVSGLSINYQHEAVLGASFRIFGASDHQTHYFRTELEDGNVCSEAMMTFSSNI